MLGVHKSQQYAADGRRIWICQGFGHMNSLATVPALGQ
jgi:hypothetical protein